MTTSEGGALGLFDRRTALQIGLGFLVAGAVIYLLAVGVGVDRLAGVLAGADPVWIALGAASTLACLTAWARAWQVVLGVLDVEVGLSRLAVTFYAATFANYVTPLGQAGGEPFIAYVLSRDTGASYERSLASVVTADLLNLMPFFTFAGVGFAALLWESALPAAARPLAVGLAAMAAGVPVLAAVGWHFRVRLGRLALRLAAPAERYTGLVSVAGLRDRLRRLNTAFERIAADPRALAHALVYSYVGWVFFTLPLVAAAEAVGLTVAPLLVLFVVPASTLAGLVPSPGGLGGVEVALSALLVALVGMAGHNAVAVTLLYRVESYWFALVVGGAAALYVIYRN